MKCKMNKPRIILVPYPAQGHVTPMLQLASALLTHGYHPVMVIPDFLHRQLETRAQQMPNDITCVSIPDGLDEDSPRDLLAMENVMENYMPPHLERLVRKLNEEDGTEVVCLIFDILASYAMNVAEKCGVHSAGFLPAMADIYHLIAAIPNLLAQGIISETGVPKQEGTLFSIPGLPITLSTKDLPWLIGTLDQRKSRFKFWTTIMNRTRTLRWLLVNSFPQEHDLNEQQCPLIIPVGPLSSHTIAKAQNPVSFWEEDMSCIDWLDAHDPSSVIYVSFGSMVTPLIGGKNIKDIALGLEASEYPFIWVLGKTWQEQWLPAEYLERMAIKNQGKIVTWAPQINVLQHEAVGCYLTHCGWNSTMEGIQSKKRMLCYPVAGDQFVNCAYIVKVWRVGITLVNDFGTINVEKEVRRVMNDSEMDGRLMRLYEETMGEKACLRVKENLTTFIDNLNKLNS